MKKFGCIGCLVGKYYYVMKIKFLVLYLLYGWLFIFSLLPLILVIIASFLSKDSIYLVNLPFTFANYFSLFNFTIIKIFSRSIILAFLTTFFCLILAYPFSYALLKTKHKSLLILLIILPFWTSSLVRTYALIAILKTKGLINNLLLHLQLIDSPLPILYSNLAVIIGLVYNLLPFMILPIFSSMERFDFKLIEAAKDLGANKLVIFRRIFLPNTANGILAGCLLVFLPAMTLFYIPDVLGGARSLLIGNLIQDQFLTINNWPQGAATSVFLTLILLIFVYRRSPKN